MAYSEVFSEEMSKQENEGALEKPIIIIAGYLYFNIQLRVMGSWISDNKLSITKLNFILVEYKKYNSQKLTITTPVYLSS